jgi:hypothetical protein
LRFSPLAWSIALLLFLVVGFNPWEERDEGCGAWGFESHGGEVTEDSRTGRESQLNSLAEKTLRNTTTNLPFCHIAGRLVAKSWVEKTGQLEVQKSTKTLRYEGLIVGTIENPILL